MFKRFLTSLCIVLEKSLDYDLDLYKLDQLTEKTSNRLSVDKWFWFKSSNYLCVFE